MTGPKHVPDRESSEVTLGKSRKTISFIAFSDETWRSIVPYVFSLQDLKNMFLV